MNSHSLERTIKRRVLEAFGMVCCHGCELFELTLNAIELNVIELNIIELNIIELNIIELIVIELIDTE